MNKEQLEKKIQAVQDKIDKHQSLVHDLERDREELEGQVAKLHGQCVMKNLDALLELVEHDRRSCNDEMLNNNDECPRCILLTAKRNGFFDERHVLRIRVEKR